MRIRAACDHVLHANRTLVDRVDLAPRCRCPLDRLPASRLLPPHSGLERSDFVLWPISTEIHCPWDVGDQGNSGRAQREFLSLVDP